MIRPKDIIGVLIPSLTIGLFAVLLASSLIRLSAIEETMRIDATQNMLWVISRAQVGSLQLQKAVSLRVKGQAKTVDVERQLNNFLSHYNILNHGPQRRQMDEMGLSGALDSIETQNPELASLIADILPGDEERLMRIREILTPYDVVLTRAANKAMVTEWDNVGGQLESSRQEISAIIISLVMIAIAGAGMTWHLVRASRSARTRARLLEREKAFSQFLVTSSSEAIVAIDLDLNTTVWNDAAEALFRLQTHEVLHRPLSTITGFFSIDRVHDAILQTVTGASRVLSDVPLFVGSDMPPVYVDLRCFPLRDGASIIGSIILISDVTEQYLARRELSDRRDYLEEQVLLRTQELNAALGRERATTEIYRNFAAMISHQFRTPLAIVDSALQRLMRRADHLTTEQVVDKGQRARSAISRLVRLVESTLDVARLDNGQIDSQTTSCDFDAIVHEAVRQQLAETPDREIHYFSDGPLLVDCDPVHTEHVIINLLSNAAKYALPDTAIRITPLVEEGLAGCRVINEGAIAPADRTHLFERYFRGSDARERSGVGIGLYMARSLARLQNGDVWVEDGSGKDVVFAFALPLTKGKSDIVRRRRS